MIATPDDSWCGDTFVVNLKYCPGQFNFGRRKMFSLHICTLLPSLIILYQPAKNSYFPFVEFDEVPQNLPGRGQYFLWKEANLPFLVYSGEWIHPAHFNLQAEMWFIFSLPGFFFPQGNVWKRLGGKNHWCGQWTDQHRCLQGMQSITPSICLSVLVADRERQKLGTEGWGSLP